MKKYDKVSDLKEQDIQDEEELLNYYLKKREGKAHEAISIHDRQEKLLELS